MNAISLAKPPRALRNNNSPSAFALGVLRNSNKIGRRFDRIDGEVRADDLTVMAIDTVLRIFDFRWMVSFDVILRRKIKDIPGAKRDAVAAAFAAFRNDVHDPARHLNLFSIKRNSPISHGRSLFQGEVIGLEKRNLSSRGESEVMNCRQIVE